MKYELALELKKAGFPQTGKGYQAPSEERERGTVEIIYFPTLEELIEACGEELENLTQIHNGTWMAENAGSRRGFITGEQSRTGRGATPKEAVARLWLALNKKV